MLIYTENNTESHKITPTNHLQQNTPKTQNCIFERHVVFSNINLFETIFGGGEGNSIIKTTAKNVIL